MWKLVGGALAGGIIGGVVGYLGKCEHGCPLTSTPWGGALYGMIIGAVLTSFFSGGSSRQDEYYLAGEQPALPNISLTDMDGKAVDLNERYASRPFVIKLGATWCPPCRKMHKELIALRKKYPEDTLGIVEIYIRESAETVASGEEPAPGIDILLDPDAVFAGRMKVSSIPVTLIYDATGRLVFRGGYASEKKIESVLDTIPSSTEPDQENHIVSPGGEGHGNDQNTTRSRAY